MSIYVTDFTDWSVLHDDAPAGAHAGSVDPATVVHTSRPDGTPDHNFLSVTCPVCDSVSTHPVGGGAQPESVQQMFVQKVDREGCPCGQVAATHASGVANSHVRLNCNRMDGPGRWQIESPVRAFQTAATPNTFEVVYVEPGDRQIVGMNPDGDVGLEHQVAVLPADPEYAVLMRTEPAYLSADGQHVVNVPAP